jgi:tetratricopeptide (TPR) repeat protein
MDKMNHKIVAGLALIVLVVSGCSTTRDGLLYRAFHNTHAKYNGFFYAKEAMAEAEVILFEEYTENWDEILPIFPPVDESTAQQVYPLMERAIEKCTNVVDKHTMSPSRRDQKDMKRPELNKWIDDNYDIIARAHLIKGEKEKALEIFQYLVRTLDYPDAQAWSNAWMARTYMAMDDRVRANNTLIKAAQINRVEDPAVRAYVYQVYADFHLKNGDVEAAIGMLEKALKHIEKEKESARTLFILAQCYEFTGQSEDAIARYNRVVDIRTPYELEFYSKIKQAMAFDRRDGNSDPIIELLEDMLEDDKNEIYQDQIYYALATLALEERRKDEGVDLLLQSLLVNLDNTRQRMKSYLQLGDIYMEELDYENAQAYYDSARTFMEDENERFDEVDAMADNLTELVDNLMVITEQDSLLEICDLSEEDRQDRIQEIIFQLEDEAEQRREAAIAAAEAELENAGDNGAGMFWPYNAQLKIAGRRNFRDFWGDRILEDHWRRSMKMMAAFSDEFGDGEENLTNTEEALEVGGDEIPSVEELLAGLPCDSVARDSSVAMIAEAYYNAGLVYKEKLSDLENAIDTWTELTERMDESEFHPTTYYQLYRTYLQREVEENYQSPFCETCNSEYWSALVLERYPDSEWAILIENPDFVDQEEIKLEEERLAYEALLQRYYAKAYQEVLMACGEIIKYNQSNHYYCKYLILKAQSTGALSARTGGDRSGYFSELQYVIRNCPDSEEEEYARELLLALDPSSLRGGKDEANASEPEAVDVVWEHKPYLEHYFGILVPVGRGNVEELKATISDFNASFYESKNLRVTANLINRNFQIILVKDFKRQDYSLEYFDVFQANTSMLEAINSSGYRSFTITTENYISLFKNKEMDSYIDWFEEVYLTDKE